MSDDQQRWLNGEMNDLHEIRQTMNSVLQQTTSLPTLNQNITLLNTNISTLTQVLEVKFDNLTDSLKQSRDSMTYKGLSYFIFLLLVCLGGIATIKAFFHLPI